jgi:copper chaperone CopZ
MKKTDELEGLCCPNCAAKIGEKARELPGMRPVSLKYPDSRLSIESEGGEVSPLGIIASIARNVDEGITVKASRGPSWKRY